MPGKSKKGGGLESSPVYKKTPFKMKGYSYPGISPMKQNTGIGEKKKRLNEGMKKSIKGNKKGNIPFPNLKDHGDGTYSYTTPDGKITLTKSEYTSAKASNKEYGY